MPRMVPRPFRITAKLRDRIRNALPFALQDCGSPGWVDVPWFQRGGRLKSRIGSYLRACVPITDELCESVEKEEKQGLRLGNGTVYDESALVGLMKKMRMCLQDWTLDLDPGRFTWTMLDDDVGMRLHYHRSVVDIILVVPMDDGTFVAFKDDGRFYTEPDTLSIKLMDGLSDALKAPALRACMEVAEYWDSDTHFPLDILLRAVMSDAAMRFPLWTTNASLYRRLDSLHEEVLSYIESPEAPLGCRCPQGMLERLKRAFSMAMLSAP